MALQKQSVNIDFSKGLDTKTDPNQIPIGKFAALKNSVFQKGKRLQKRNGFGNITSLSASLNTITTHNDNLTAVGSSLYAYSNENMQWVNRGSIYSVQLDTLPLVRSSSGQQSVDVAVTDSGLICTVWKDTDGNSKYQVISQNGQIIVAQTNLPTGAVLPRVFLVGNFFVITFLITITATVHLQYISVPITNLSNPSAATDISTQVKAITSAYDGQVVNRQLYISWDGSDGGGAVRSTYIDATLTQHGTVTIAGKNAAKISICGDTSGGAAIIWLTFTDSSNDAYSAAYSTQLAAILAATKVISTITIVNLTSTATAGVLTIYYEVSNTYSYSPNAQSDYIAKKTITQAGSVGSASTILRGVGLQSKAFFLGTTAYMLATYGGAYQPTYFLIDSSGNVVAKLAYSNGGGYPIDQVLSNAIVIDGSVSIGYLIKDQLTSINKSQSGSVGGVYSQTGINLATFTIDNNVMPSVEIGGSIHFASGFLWMYDGVKPVEHGFHLWPEDLNYTTTTTTGFLSAQIYYYQVTYEWTDSQGNIHRSAPSIPLKVDLTGSGTATNKNTIHIPTLRTTYKVSPNKVRIMVWRWSTAQQNYYQVTSISSPTLNDTTADSIDFVDTLADASIVGNALIYTTGGVIENIGAPACNDVALYKSRLLLIDAEDENLVWFSKQVIENTPVEMSDLLTIFAAPTIGSQGSTGPVKVISSMDDKIILFKQDAPYYITGQGPDNTGANNDFSDPVYITSSVGCDNSNVIFMPQGIMFQSDKGIWLLGRDLSTSYIGAPAEDLTTNQLVLSSVAVPGTNQVRFTLDSGITLMYDYYFGEWGTFTDIPAISGTIYNGLHTVLNTYGAILQETQGVYVDGALPVLMSFTTGWINLAGLQGYQRAYYFYMLANYLSPHKVQMQIAYDYNPSPSQSSIISPDNFSPAYGGDPLYGSSSPYGGPSQVEQWRVFLQQQKCEAFQITFTEIYDPSQGVVAGAGLTVSGIDLVVGIKSSYPRISPSRSVG